jgi:hypothetical protein
VPAKEIRMHRPGKALSFIVIGALVLAFISVAALLMGRRPLSWSGEASPERTLQAAPASKIPASVLSPSLYCAFNDLQYERIVVAFSFAVTRSKDAPPSFKERAEGTHEGTRTFDANQSPTWPFAHDEDGTPMITSPDGATRILLYGLKLDTPGVIIDEAGLRSNYYRNLQGQCQQANFGGSG